MRFVRQIMRDNRPAKGWKRFLCGLFVCSILAGLMCETEAHAEAEEIKLYASSAVLLDGSSGRVLYGKDEEKQMAMASTTKIMTCILVLENADLNEAASVSAYAASMPQVKLNVRKGERYRVGDLLYSLMLESHNDTAVVLAEHVGKKSLEEDLMKKDVSAFSREESKEAVRAFADLMNQKAVELGCTHTYFVTPNGLDDIVEEVNKEGEAVEREHMTTAKDLATIMKYCIGESEKAGEFLEITGRSQYSFSANGRFYSCSNHNSFLQMMDGAISGKTGFTNKAGYCYVGALKQGGKTLIVALLACGWPNHKTYKWADTKKLMQYGLEYYEPRNILEGAEAFHEKLLMPIPVREGRCDDWEKGIVIEAKICGAGKGEKPTDILMKKGEQVVRKCYLKRELEAPVFAGSIIGKVDYCIDNQVYYSENIIVDNTILRIDLKWCAEKVLDLFLL